MTEWTIVVYDLPRVTAVTLALSYTGCLVLHAY